MLTLAQKSKICLGCLQCCITLAIPTNTVDLDFYRTRGLEAISVGNQWFLVLEWPCQHLTLAGCRIYSERPETCQRYWGYNDPFLKRCDLRDVKIKDMTEWIKQS
jgi:Fe-S-cluster containining protein